MKILIVSRTFFPENSPRSFRTTELAKELARTGHEVVVYIPKEGYNYSDFEKKNQLVVKDLGPLRFRTIKITGNFILKLAKKIIQRAGLQLLEYPAIELLFRVFNGLRMEQGYDIAISIAAPHPIHWGMARSIRKNPGLAKIWIADCGDPYMGSPLETIRKPFYFKYFEKNFCRTADYITVPTEGAIDAYYPEFRSKIAVIPQGFRMEGLKIWEGAVKNPIPNFAYAGNISSKGVRCPISLLKYLIKWQDDFRFHIYSSVGGGVLSQFKKTLGSRLVIHEPIERELLIYTLSQMDFLVNFDNGTSRQTPSKLIDYTLSGRPILNFYPLTPTYNLVNEFLSGDYRNQLTIRNIQQYNIINVANKFLKLGIGASSRPN